VNDEAANPSAWPDIEVAPYRRRRDWRWWVGGVGRVLVAVGLLLLAFVAYQLWGTGIQTRQAQNRLEQQFAETVSSSPSSATTTVPTTVAGPTSSAAATTTTTTTPATLPPAVLGDPVARLEAPSIGLDWIVVSGVGVDELKKGPGHYPDTPLPGQGGNVGIAGHRTTYGAPFFRVDELAPGDDVILTSTTGDRFVYKVTEQFIVSPSQYEVLAPSAQPILTLTSCHPRYSASKRIIVRAALDPAQSAPLLDAAPAPTTTTSAPATTSEPAPGSTVAPVPETTAPRQAAVIGGPELERGWFDDPDAWPQVALWGLALTATALLAWTISRRTGHNWIGALAGIVPFIVCLYFFFENVNRLLPPNI